MWTFREIEPTPARGYVVPAMWDSDRFVAEVKEDGDRRIAQFCGQVVRFTGRMSRFTGKVVEKSANIPHLSAISTVIPGGGAVVGFSPPMELDGTVLDGEIVVTGPMPHGGKSKYVTQIMGSGAALAVQKQQARGWLRYRVFDCLFWKGDDIRSYKLQDRQAYALCAVRTWGNEYAEFIEQAISGKRSFYKRIISAGGEGIILKDTLAPYDDEKAWAKVKREATADVFIMGFKEARAESKKKDGSVTPTKYAASGMIGAIRCGQYLRGNMVEVATISGMDDALRKTLTDRPQDFMYKVVEIKHNGREPTLRFRHPRFGRFRDDKLHGDCVVRPNEV